MRSLNLLLLASLSSLGCPASGGQVAVKAPEHAVNRESVSVPAAPRGPRLVLRGQGLWIVGISDGYKRGALLYVRDAQPLPGSTTHPHIGIVQGIDLQGDALKVAWYCKPAGEEQKLVPQDGLPVEGLRQDTQIRLGRCWGRYLPAPPMAALPRDRVRLTLNLGSNEGIRALDKFEVLGPANVDDVNHVITGFATLGLCSVLPFDITHDRAVCELDRGVAKAFDREAWSQGGFVHLSQ